MIDTHCHLDFIEFDVDRESLLVEAEKLNVSAIVVPAVLERHWGRLIHLCQQPLSLPLYYALGLHPCFMADHGLNDDALMNAFEQRLIERIEIIQSNCGGVEDDLSNSKCEPKGKLVAIGEIGLDYFSDTNNRAQQISLFEMQLSVAKRQNLPVILHVRKAHDDVLKRLRQIALPKAGIVHSFSGSEQQAAQYCDLGFALGIGGAATYDRAKKLHRLIQKMPIESFVLETDAPDIPPAFARGERNSPLNLPRIAESLAYTRGVSLEELSISTTENANRILGLPLV